MTTVRLSQRNVDDIATTIQTGHDFTASTLVGRRARATEASGQPNRYVIYTGDEVLAVLNTDDSTARVTTAWEDNPTAKRHMGIVGQVLGNLGFWSEGQDTPLEF